MRPLLAGALIALAAGARPAAADSDAPPPYYVAALVGTTLADRPSGGSFGGWQHDLTPAIGIGRLVSETLAVELDVAPSFVRGDYMSFSLVPGVVWAFAPHVYAAARFVVPVDPELNLGLYPGIGVIQSFGSLSLVAEFSVFSYVGRGDADLGAALTIGALYSF